MPRSSLERLIIYTDGGARGNPGPAAIGVVFTGEGGRAARCYGQAIGVKTNNEAEYEAVRFALQKARALFGKARTRAMRVELCTDSELVCRQLAGRYKVAEERLWPLFMRVWNLRLDFGEIVFRHVPRSENREADRLVNEALDRAQGRLL